MLATRKTNPDRIFVPIVPLRSNRNVEKNAAETIRKMADKNPALQSLITAFDLSADI
jgi:hypothetical protein